MCIAYYSLAQFLRPYKLPVFLFIKHRVKQGTVVVPVKSAVLNLSGPVLLRCSLHVLHNLHVPLVLLNNILAETVYQD